MRVVVGPVLLMLLAACTSASSASDEQPATEGSAGATDESPATETSGEPSETETDGTGETGDTDEPPANPLLVCLLVTIAHPGVARLRPEATFVAFDHARAVCADVIEFDLHASFDGVVVVIHDDTVDRTTDG